MSRQEKGYDFALMKCSAEGSRVVTFQVKASRTYTAEARLVNDRRRFRYTGFFKCFEVPEQVDYILICSMSAPDPLRTRPVKARWYRDCTAVVYPGGDEVVLHKLSHAWRKARFNVLLRLRYASGGLSDPWNPRRNSKR